MPAERDQSQKFKFVYSNLYQLYRKGLDAAHAAPEVVEASSASSSQVISHHAAQPMSEPTVIHQARPAVLRGLRTEPTRTGIVSGTVIKSASRVQPLVRPHRAAELRPNHRINFSEIHAQAARSQSSESMNELKKNLSELDELQSKLRFMLKELEDLSKGSKS